MLDPQPIPAATLVLFRHAPSSGPPEILMVERAKAMAFAGGAMVFPGGRIDPGDRLLAEMHSEPDAAARIAAIRETLEEAGLAVGLHPPPSPDLLADIRTRLHDGEAFARILEAAGIGLDLSQLVPFARWLPAHKHARIFDTLFFLARAPADAQATVDRTENARLVWTTARAMMDDVDAGRAAAIFPTRRNLERLARFGSYEEAVADARAHPIRTVTPYVEMRDGVEHLCIPGDLGYPVTSEPLTSATRG